MDRTYKRQAGSRPYKFTLLTHFKKHVRLIKSGTLSYDKQARKSAFHVQHSTTYTMSVVFMETNQDSQLFLQKLKKSHW